MKFGFSIFFFIKKHILEVIEDVVSHGVKNIELSYEIPHVLNMDDAFVAKMAALKRNGIDFSMHGPLFEVNLGSFWEEIRKLSMKRTKETIDMAYKIGCNPVVIHPGYTFWKDKIKDIADTTRGYFVEDLREVSIYAKERGISIALEHVPMHFFFFYDLQEFKELHSKMPDIGIVLDIGHAYMTKCVKGEKDPEGAIIEDLKEIGMEHVFHVHLHNNMGKTDDHHILDGKIDVKRVLKFLNEEGYSGKVIIESYDMEEKGISAVLNKLKEISP